MGGGGGCRQTYFTCPTRQGMYKEACFMRHTFIYTVYGHSYSLRVFGVLLQSQTIAFKPIHPQKCVDLVIEPFQRTYALQYNQVILL